MKTVNDLFEGRTFPFLKIALWLRKQSGKQLQLISQLMKTKKHAPRKKGGKLDIEKYNGLKIFIGTSLFLLCKVFNFSSFMSFGV